MSPAGTIVHLDAVGGVAGDMFVAAMLDAMPELAARVLADAAAVLPDGLAPTLREGSAGALRVRRFGLSGTASAGEAHFCALRGRIEAAPLSAGTAEHAVAILTALAEAEAGIHGVPLADVHFHEIGDWDSLMDVVAAGSIAAAMAGARWTVSDLPRGGGLVATAHGALPVPAPATLALLAGFAFRDDGVRGERVTPTGAAILRHLGAVPPSPGALGRLVATGTGAGTRELPLPNVLRATVYAGSGEGADAVCILAFDVDDMTGEEVATAADRLRAVEEVRDLMLLQAVGKKGRPAVRFELLVSPDAVDAVAAACFRETSTIGLRWWPAARATLTRSAATGDGLRVKWVARPGGVTAKAEQDDLAPIATLGARRRAAAAAEAASEGDAQRHAERSRTAGGPPP